MRHARGVVRRAVFRAAIVAVVVLECTSALQGQAPPTQAAPAPDPPPQAAKPAPSASEITFTGFVKLVGFYDFGGLQGQDGFKITQIDTSENRNNDDRLSADLKQTRVRLDAVRRGTRVGDVTAVVEADFRGSGGSTVNLRLRHAYFTVGGLTVGQTRTVFGDPDADASVVDLEGPPTGIALRTPQVRFASSAESRWRWTVAAEVSGLDYSTLPDFDPDVFSTYLRWPDFTASLRYGSKRNHVQVAGVVREIGYRRRLMSSGETESESESLTGGGVAVSGRFTLSARNRLVYQAVAGKGITHYLASFGGGGWDAVPDGRGELKATTDTGGYLAYMHTSGRFRATALVGGAAITNPIREGLPDFFKGVVASVTGFCDVLDSLWVGLEVDYGRKRDFAERTGDAVRVQFAVQATF
jgi:hypothetical protein